ncbi:MAG TPA: hypothetical protein VGE06_14340 [Flavisolibacter sp.]
MKAAIILFFTCTFYLSACSQQEAADPVPQVTDYVLPLGHSTVTVQKTSFTTNSPFLFVHLHSNETTAAAVAQAVSAKKGIPFVQIRNGNERLLSFRLAAEAYRFDPNRMFSGGGIRNTLSLYNKSTEAALSAVRSFSDTVLALLDTGKIIVALHNNTNERFSILTYQERNLPVHINSSHDPDDFFLTNDEEIFTRLRSQNFNVALEDVSKVEDDGSLSLYCSRQNIRYVNVEAEHGHLQEQASMLAALLQLLR